jgi:uncharacterized membrane protein YhaH (DUF805 family)
MIGRELEKILTRSSQFRSRLLMIHGLTTLALLLIHFVVIAYGLLPKWTFSIPPILIIVWGVIIMGVFEMYHRRSRKEIDKYFEETYSKIKTKNENHIRSSLEE